MWSPLGTCRWEEGGSILFLATGSAAASLNTAEWLKRPHFPSLMRLKAPSWDDHFKTQGFCRGCFCAIQQSPRQVHALGGELYLTTSMELNICLFWGCPIEPRLAWNSLCSLLSLLPELGWQGATTTSGLCYLRDQIQDFMQPMQTLYQLSPRPIPGFCFGDVGSHVVKAGLKLACYVVEDGPKLLILLTPLSKYWVQACIAMHYLS